MDEETHRAIHRLLDELQEHVWFISLRDGEAKYYIDAELSLKTVVAVAKAVGHEDVLRSINDPEREDDGTSALTALGVLPAEHDVNRMLYLVAHPEPPWVWNRYHKRWVYEDRVRWDSVDEALAAQI